MLQQTSQECAEASNRSDDSDVVESLSTTNLSGPTDKSGDQWFAAIARDIYPAKAGAMLALLTGFDERSCQRYAAGQVAPPGYFIRALLRSDHGLQWYRALMYGCARPWYADLGRVLDQIIVNVRALGLLIRK